MCYKSVVEINSTTFIHGFACNYVKTMRKGGFCIARLKLLAWDLTSKNVHFLQKGIILLK